MGDVTYIQIKQKDGYLTNLTHYKCEKPPIASILILHGMAEHQQRYEHFCSYLNSSSYDVYIYDHRGHGKERRLFELGYIAPENGNQLIVSDAITASKYIEENNRSSKLFLFGHSMGSLIARNVIQSYDHYQGVILSGTMFPYYPMARTAYLIATITKHLKGPKKLSPFLNNLLFGSKYFTAHTSRTVFDWLTRSNPIVGAYIHDPYCGFLCTTTFYQDLLALVLDASKNNLISKTNKNLPILIASGEKDPVSSYTKEIKRYAAVLKELEFHNIDTKIYPECRHEILNELNRDEVYSDIVTWMKSKL